MLGKIEQTNRDPKNFFICFPSCIRHCVVMNESNISYDERRELYDQTLIDTLQLLYVYCVYKNSINNIFLPMSSDFGICCGGLFRSIHCLLR